MKAYKVIMMAFACCVLSACNEDKTTVSKPVIGGGTIVSTPTGSGDWTRTEYKPDFWGNPTTTVSRGHTNATQQEDLWAIAGRVAVWAIGEIFED